MKSLNMMGIAMLVLVRAIDIATISATVITTLVVALASLSNYLIKVALILSISLMHELFNKNIARLAP